jgi:hypothetical protein
LSSTWSEKIDIFHLKDSTISAAAAAVAATTKTTKNDEDSDPIRSVQQGPHYSSYLTFKA